MSQRVVAPARQPDPTPPAENVGAREAYEHLRLRIPFSAAVIDAEALAAGVSAVALQSLAQSHLEWRLADLP